MDVIGLRMKDFQDMYEVTDNLGQSYLRPGDLHSYLCKTNTLITAFLLPLKIELHNYNGSKSEKTGGRPDGETHISLVYLQQPVLHPTRAVCPVC